MPSLAPRRLPPHRSAFARQPSARSFALSRVATSPTPAAPTQPHRAAAASPLPSAAPSSSSSSATSSVNAAEISHFSKLSEQWWDEHGELALLHKMNPSRLAFLRLKLEESARRFGKAGTDAERELRGGQWLAGLDVLDVGCGAGLLSESLARLGAQTLGVDATPSNIPLARAHALLDPLLASPAPGSTTGKPRLEYRHQTAEDLLAAEGEARFDVVCAMEVLEHVDDAKGFLLNLTKLVKPGGHILLSTISRTPFAHLLTVTMAESVLRLVSPGTHHSHKFVKPAELDAFFDGLGWASADVPAGLAAAGPSTAVGGSVREARGVAYLPWKGEWELMTPALGELGKQCNYFYFVRRPSEGETARI